MSDDTADHILDTSGLKCPLPVLKARKTLADMAGGAVIRVIATDPGAPEDLRHFCDAAGHRLIDQSRADDGSSVTRIAKRQ
ncbi:MAG: sulfurtransferase TusA family protein [Alphaproteobacteria bacterium]